jgi:hypothetical protein
VKRWAARVDENQKEITRALRLVGASVQTLHRVGQGCPDLLVGYRCHNYLFELKNPDAPPNKQRLTECESKWHVDWRGRVEVVRSVDEVLRAIGAIV